jgi:thiamine biosynthesis lipoprotein
VTAAGESSAPSGALRVGRVMGTVASLHVRDTVPQADLQRVAGAVFGELERLEAMFSTYRPTSEICRIDRGELHLLDASREVLDVFDACRWLEHESDGAFSARSPDGRLDPAGFVKGWATERACRFLTSAGLEHWYLGVGGDLLAHGGQAPGEPWQMAIADPRQRNEIVAVLDITSGAVATSGTSERGRHLWDGRRRAAVDPIASLTVTGPSLAWADALATAAFARGDDALDWLSRYDDYHGVAVGHDGAISTTPGFVLAPPSPR